MSVPVSEALNLLGIKTTTLRPEEIVFISSLLKEIGTFLAFQCASASESSPEQFFPPMFTGLLPAQKYIQQSISFLRGFLCVLFSSILSILYEDGPRPKAPSALATLSDLKDIQDRILSSIKPVSQFVLSFSEYLSLLPVRTFYSSSCSYYSSVPKITNT